MTPSIMLLRAKDGLRDITSLKDQGCILTRSGSAYCEGRPPLPEVLPAGAERIAIAGGDVQVGPDGIARGASVLCGIDAARRLSCSAETWEGTFVDVVGAMGHVCALHDTGRIECRRVGPSDGHPIEPPAGTFTQLASGHHHLCALDPQGRAHC